MAVSPRVRIRLADTLLETLDILHAVIPSSGLLPDRRGTSRTLRALTAATAQFWSKVIFHTLRMLTFEIP